MGQLGPTFEVFHKHLPGLKIAWASARLNTRMTSQALWREKRNAPKRHENILGALVGKPSGNPFMTSSRRLEVALFGLVI
jgi:hypothetical protein